MTKKRNQKPNRKSSKKSYPIIRSFSMLSSSMIVFLVIGMSLVALLIWHPWHKAPLSDQPEGSNATANNKSEIWGIKKPSNGRQVDGYAMPSSVTTGENLTFFVSCKANSFSTDIFRLGYYGGSDAKLVEKVKKKVCEFQKTPTPDPNTGLIIARWPASLNVLIEKSWQPGVYLARVTDNEGYQSFVPFIVRSSAVKSQYLFIHSVADEEAYNYWGGNSLYQDLTPKLGLPRAVEVSLERPFIRNSGAGFLLAWEYPMIKFLEQHNYSVDYATDLDVNNNPAILKKYKAVIIDGHDEYWTHKMWDGYLDAVHSGTNLAVFAANTAYRFIRVENDPVTNQPDSVIVCYKNSVLDPETKINPQLSTPKTIHFAPLNLSESELLGETWGGENLRGKYPNLGYISNIDHYSGNLVVTNSSSWIFQGTDLKSGDVIPGVVGYEYDRYLPTTPHPAPVSIIFAGLTKNTKGITREQDSVYYSLPDGGQVFDAGTIEWSWGLDPALPTYSPQLVKVTENILNHFGQ